MHSGTVAACDDACDAANACTALPADDADACNDALATCRDYM
jgi:hypothetical protein